MLGEVRRLEANKVPSLFLPNLPRNSKKIKPPKSRVASLIFRSKTAKDEDALEDALEDASGVNSSGNGVY